MSINPYNFYPNVHNYWNNVNNTNNDRMDEEDEDVNLKKEVEGLKSNNHKMVNNDFLCENQNITFPPMQEIGVDQFGVTMGDCIGTIGLSCGYVVCATGCCLNDMGQPINGTTVLALARILFMHPKTALENVINALTGKRCSYSSIRTFVIGGTSETLDIQKIFLEECEPDPKYKIYSMRFNVLKDDTEVGLDVVLTKDVIFYSQKSLCKDVISEKEERLKREVERLKSNNPKVLDNDFVIDYQNIKFPPMLNVDMDRFGMTKGPCIGTYGVSSCFVVLGKGCRLDDKGHPIDETTAFALAHISSLIPPKIALKSVINALSEKEGCSDSSIKTCVIGGIRESKDRHIRLQTLETQKIFLKCALDPQYKIHSMRFDVLKNEKETLDVVLTKDGLSHCFVTKYIDENPSQ